MIHLLCHVTFYRSLRTIPHFSSPFPYSLTTVPLRPSRTFKMDVTSSFPDHSFVVNSFLNFLDSLVVHFINPPRKHPSPYPLSFGDSTGTRTGQTLSQCFDHTYLGSLPFHRPLFQFPLAPWSLSFFSELLCSSYDLK